MNLERIDASTHVHDFPDIHNGNITELEKEIDRLQGELDAKQTEINDLKTKFNSALNALRAEYMAMFDKCVKIEDNQ